jgi:diguanylate cyclase (GGDEF)-like protein
MSPSAAQPDDQRHLMRRVAGLLYAAGSATTVAAIALPHSPKADIGGFWALAALMAAVAWFLLRGPARRFSGWIFPAFMVLGSAIITLALYFNGERFGGPAADNEVLYLWIALYAGYFFSRIQLFVQLTVIASGYAMALLLIHPGQIGVTRWLITMGVVTVSANVVYALRRRNDQLVARLSEAARTDPLTGLVNRKGFDEALARELANATRAGRSLALLFCDIDNFKALNDRLGHPTGDAVLAAVGSVSLDLVRFGDTMARIGGDEFAAILPNTTGPGASDTAERLRRLVADAVNGEVGPIAMSFGVAVGCPHGKTSEDLIREADRALYEAKRLGRNRGVIASIDPVPETDAESGTGAEPRLFAPARP